MIPLITITGTESTGKTQLAIELAAHYKTLFVPDCSRLYIEKIYRDYNRNDVLEIAQMIIEEENKMLLEANRFLFSDNCLINIKMWLQYYKWEVPKWLDEEIVNRRNNLHLLCDIDIEWVADEQRKNPNDRKELFEQFKQELKLTGTNFFIIKESNKQRTKNAIQVIEDSR